MMIRNRLLCLTGFALASLASPVVAADYPNMLGDWMCTDDFRLDREGFQDTSASFDHTVHITEQREAGFVGEMLWSQDKDVTTSSAPEVIESNDDVVVFREELLGTFVFNDREFVLVNVDDSGDMKGEMTGPDSLVYLYSEAGEEPKLATASCTRKTAG